MTSNPIVKFPQILGAALSANVFVIIAQSVASLTIFDWFNTSFVVLIFLWNLKDGIDDFKSYEAQKMEGFSLAPTVTFRVISYLCLVVAVSNIEEIDHLILAMTAYFFTFFVWSLNSIWRRRKLNSQSHENAERLSRRRGWLVLYGFSAGCCIAMLADKPLLTVSAMFLLYVIFVADSIHCRTFSNEINETL